uniref:Sulfotransferase n=1 Tax=Cynoglossus semilaevis TaxID=244447 RepID=A0A3P8UIQ0_CYNSE
MDRLDVTEIFEGISFPGHLHTLESLQFAISFPFQDQDILIVSYPKSGTTWVQEMVTLICSRGDPSLTQSVPNWARAPWLEHYYCASVLGAASLRSSLHFRNPKDVVVSFYHFHKMANFLPEAETFEEFLKKFLMGTLSYGSWFDHVKGWTCQTATLENLLHLTYEEMKQTTYKTNIIKVSSFLQHPLLEEEVNNCVQHCSFSSMKNNNMVNYTLVSDHIMDHSKGCFMRKGKTGDWKNLFTEEQNHYFNDFFKSNMQDCALDFVWEVQDEEEVQENHEEQVPEKNL